MVRLSYPGKTAATCLTTKLLRDGYQLCPCGPAGGYGSFSDSFHYASVAPCNFLLMLVYVRLKHWSDGFFLYTATLASIW